MLTNVRYGIVILWPLYDIFVIQQLKKLHFLPQNWLLVFSVLSFVHTFLLFCVPFFCSFFILFSCRSLFQFIFDCFFLSTCFNGGIQTDERTNVLTKRSGREAMRTSPKVMTNFYTNSSREMLNQTIICPIELLENVFGCADPRDSLRSLVRWNCVLSSSHLTMRFFSLTHLCVCTRYMCRSGFLVVHIAFFSRCVFIASQVSQVYIYVVVCAKFLFFSY